jgi:hypothetical protein
MLVCLGLFVLTIIYVGLCVRVTRTQESLNNTIKSMIELATHVEDLYKILKLAKKWEDKDGVD